MKKYKVIFPSITVELHEVEEGKSVQTVIELDNKTNTARFVPIGEELATIPQRDMLIDLGQWTDGMTKKQAQELIGEYYKQKRIKEELPKKRGRGRPRKNGML